MKGVNKTTNRFRLFPSFKPDLTKPTIEFYEEGDWMRIEIQGQKTRYMKRLAAEKMLSQIAVHSSTHKIELILPEIFV